MFYIEFENGTTYRYLHVLMCRKITICGVPTTGFYLGYLRVEASPPKCPASPPPPPQKKILLSLQYISNYTGKSVSYNKQANVLYWVWKWNYLQVLAHVNVSKNTLNNLWCTHNRVLSRVFKGRSFSPKCPASPPKILLSLQYISNYTGKIIQTQQDQCHKLGKGTKLRL